MRNETAREPLMLSHVSMCYGGKTALTDVSFTAEPGTRIFVTGASGSGKSTLLRLLVGLEQPTGGTVSGAPRRAAVVFQEDRLVEEATVLRNVLLVLPRPTDRTAAKEILVALGLGNELSAVAGTLSGGMKRRVALARALVAGGDALVLDEPLTGLDGETKEAVLGVIRQHIGGRTLILVTHDAAEAAALGCNMTVAL
ncbi:MAG: ATP-binding cassette domain-containing protein [Clostridia bacterium]|nr:ATP-binding cassette domain-containing protein [Clostridia bacterium]